MSIANGLLCPVSPYDSEGAVTENIGEAIKPADVASGFLAAIQKLKELNVALAAYSKTYDNECATFEKITQDCLNQLIDANGEWTERLVLLNP